MIAAAIGNASTPRSFRSFVAGDKIKYNSHVASCWNADMVAAPRVPHHHAAAAASAASAASASASAVGSGDGKGAGGAGISSSVSSISSSGLYAAYGPLNPLLQPLVGPGGGAAGAGVAVRTHRTLDLEHSSVMQRLGKERMRADALRQEASKVHARVAELQGRSPTDLSDSEFWELQRCCHARDGMISNADDAEERGNEVDYFVRTADILFKYYDIIDKNQQQNQQQNQQHQQPKAAAAAADSVADSAADSSVEFEGLATLKGCCPIAPVLVLAPAAPGGALAAGAGAGAGILRYFNVSFQEQLRPPDDLLGDDRDAAVVAAASPGTKKQKKPLKQQKACGCGLQQTHLMHPKQIQDDRATLFDRYMCHISSDVPVVPAAAMAAASAAAAASASAPVPTSAVPPKASTASASAAAAASAAASAAAAAASATAIGAHSWGSGACGHCGSIERTVQLHDGYVFCNHCFTMEYILIDHEKPSYKDPPKEVAYFAYKRINHFNEWLNQVQGKETTDIPDEVYDSILFEIKKQKLTNMAKLTCLKVRNILKKLRINKYYEHIPHIINRLNGMPSPHLAPELEDRLRHMFCQIQVPFLKHSPMTRQNFLSYSFCLNKMMQLLEKDQYLDSFPLLKSREKLHQQDIIWKKICNELGWDFIPSL